MARHALSISEVALPNPVRRSLLACLLLLTAEPARAQSLDPVPFGIVIRGGGSLGAFEAGALYYLAALAEQNPGLVDLRLITGTSAGSINAVLGVVEGCGKLAPKPEDSLYFKTWAGIGLQGLFDPARAGATGIFTRGPMQALADQVEARWNAGLNSGCDMVIGIPVTRVIARRLPIVDRNQMDVARVDERFVVRIQGRGPGKPPRMTNYVAHHPGVPAPALVTDDAGEITFAALMQVVFASSGVPVVFRPVALPFCLVTETKPGPIICRLADAETVELVDGGLLDNQPLRLAVNIANTGLDGAVGDPKWRAAPDLSDAILPADMAFLAIDPTAMTWLPSDAPKKTQATSLTELLESLLPGVLESALTAELQQVLVEQPDVGKRLGVVQGDWPLMSGGLGSLLGFMERDFRTFDFYLGMVEARRVSEQLILPWANRGSLPDPAPTAAAYAAWQPYRCALTVLRGEVADCDGVDRQFLAQLQTSIDRAASACRALSPDAANKLPDGPDSDARAYCKMVHARGDKASIRVVPGVPNAGKGRVADPEPSHDETLRLLVLHHFAFRDLGLGHASLHAVRMHISSLVHDMLGVLADHQAENAGVWRIVGRTVSQALAYRAPDHALHLIAGGTWELGWSATDGDAAWSWWRLGLALQFDGVPSALDGEVSAYFAMTVGAGIELEAYADMLAQVRIGLRGGFRWSTGDRFRANLDNPTPGAPRSRPVAELYTSLTLIQWLRVQLGVSWFPPFEGDAGSWAIRPMLGIELDLPL